MYTCPLCKSVLQSAQGSEMDYNKQGALIRPPDGITLYCNNLECPAQQVMGHGTSEAKAFEVITEKFKHN